MWKPPLFFITSHSIISSASCPLQVSQKAKFKGTSIRRHLLIELLKVQEYVGWKMFFVAIFGKHNLAQILLVLFIDYLIFSGQSVTSKISKAMSQPCWESFKDFSSHLRKFRHFTTAQWALPILVPPYVFPTSRSCSPQLQCFSPAQKPGSLSLKVQLQRELPLRDPPQ